MAKKCIYKYLDEHGNESIHYYGIVDEVGHTAALENYLNHMAPTITAKFKRILPDGVENTLDWLLQEHEKVERGEINRSEYISVTDILKENMEKFGDEASIAVAIMIKAEELRDKALKAGNSMTIRAAKEKAVEYFKYDLTTKKAETNEGEFEELKALATKGFTDGAKQGSSVHKIVQLALEARNKRKKAFMEADDPDATNPDMNFKRNNLSTFVNEAIKEFDENYAGDKDTPDLTNAVKHGMYDIVGDVLELIEQFEEEYGPLEVLPELNIVGRDVKYNSDQRGKKKVYGIADIVLYSKSKNIAIVIDLKTKSSNSILNYDSAYAGNMINKLEGQPATPAMQAKVQTATYASILKNDYGIDVVKTVSMPLAFHIGVHTDQATGEKKLLYTSYNAKATPEPQVALPITPVVEDIFDIEKGDDFEPPGKLDQEFSDMFDGKIESVGDNSKHIKLQEALIKKTKDGMYYWRDPYAKKPYKRKTKEELKKIIRGIYKDFDRKKKESRVDLIYLFKNGKPRKNSIWARGKFRQKAAFILEGMSPETHDVFTRDDLPELRDVGEDIIVFQDKKTKELTIVSLSNVYNSRYEFEIEGEEDARTTIFGPVLTDEAAKKEYGDAALRADTHNLQLIKAATVASKLKKTNPKEFGKVKVLHSVTLLGSFDNFRTSTMGTQIGVIRTLANEFSNAGRPIATDIEIMVNNEDLFDPELYEQDPFMALVELVREGRDPLRTVGGDPAYASRQLAARIKQLDEEGKSLDSDYILEKRLSEYLKQARIATAAKKRISINDTDAITKDSDYMIANNALLALKGMYLKTAPKFKGGVLGNYQSLKTLNDPYADAAARNIELSEQRARDDIAIFASEHDNWIKKLLKDRDDITEFDLRNNRDVTKKLFGRMLVDDFEFDPENTDNWMRFKDPETDPDLTDLERDYIRWYNKKVKYFMKKLHKSDEFSYMYPEDGESESWKKNSIPIIKKINSQGLKDMMADPKGYAKRKISKAIKPSERERNKNIEAPWEYDTTFLKQVDTNPGRGSAYTRELLGISDDGTAIPEKRNIEINPITILNTIAINTAKKEHFEQAAVAASALDASLAAAATTFKDAGVDVEPIRGILDKFHKMLIHGRFKEDQQMGKILDVLGKGASFGLFFGSWRQFITETSTAGTQLASATLSGMFNDILFGADSSKKFGNKDIAWAAKQMITPFGDQILADFGWYNSDLGMFAGEEFNQLRKKFLWSTKWGTAPIHNVLKQGTQAGILAQLHKEGITKDAYELNKDTGRWEYREEKDKRFYVYDESLDFGEKHPPETPEEKRRHAYWKAHRRTLSKEGAIRNDRMIRPLTIEHANAIKHYVVRLLGSMDNKQLLAAEWTAAGRAIAKFKRWMVQKVDNYYHTHEISTKEGAWEEVIDPETGEVIDFKFTAQEYEGYIQSVMGIIKELKDHGWSWNKIAAELSPRRKENLSKLLADLLLWILLMYTVNHLLMVDNSYAEEFGLPKEVDTAFMKDMRKGVANSMADVMPLQGLYSIATGSPSAAAAISMNVVRNLVVTSGYVVTGNLDKAKQGAEHTMQTFGAYRFGEGLIDTYNKYK